MQAISATRPTLTTYNTHSTKHTPNHVPAAVHFRSSSQKTTPLSRWLLIVAGLVILSACKPPSSLNQTQGNPCNNAGAVGATAQTTCRKEVQKTLQELDEQDGTTTSNK